MCWGLLFYTLHDMVVLKKPPQRSPKVGAQKFVPKNLHNRVLLVVFCLLREASAIMGGFFNPTQSNPLNLFSVFRSCIILLLLAFGFLNFDRALLRAAHFHFFCIIFSKVSLSTAAMLLRIARRSFVFSSALIWCVCRKVSLIKKNPFYLSLILFFVTTRPIYCSIICIVKG